MRAVSTIRERFAAMRGSDRWGVFLVAVGLGFLTTGYAAGSVLAGESLADQLWAVPLLAGTVATAALLLHGTDT